MLKTFRCYILFCIFLDILVIVIVEFNMPLDMNYINVIFSWNTDHGSAAICVCGLSILSVFYSEYNFIILLADDFCPNNEYVLL